MRHITTASERPFLGAITAACIGMSLLALAAADPKWLEFEAADTMGAGVAYDMTALHSPETSAAYNQLAAAAK